MVGRLDINDNTMEVRCFLYSCMLLLGLGGEVVSAQTFRRIKNVRELEDGAHYVWPDIVRHIQTRVRDGIAG